jgi:hypothetical protein
MQGLDLEIWSHQGQLEGNDASCISLGAHIFQDKLKNSIHYTWLLLDSTSIPLFLNSPMH